MVLLLVLQPSLAATDCVPPHQCPPPPPPCACANQTQCRALQTPPPSSEIFTFSLAGAGANLSSQFYRYNWDLVTTAAWMTAGNESTCWAHAHGARVTTSSNWRALPPPHTLTTAARRPAPLTLRVGLLGQGPVQRCQLDGAVGLLQPPHHSSLPHHLGHEHARQMRGPG